MEKTWNRSGQSYYQSAFMLIQEVKKKPKTSSKELHVSLVSMKSVKDKKDTGIHGLLPWPERTQRHK